MQARTGDAPSDSARNQIGTRSERRSAQKETDRIPKLNRMPDGPLGVKVDTSNLQLGTVGGERAACPNPGADGPHGGQVIVQVVHGIQNLCQ